MPSRDIGRPSWRRDPAEGTLVQPLDRHRVVGVSGRMIARDHSWSAPASTGSLRRHPGRCMKIGAPAAIPAARLAFGGGKVHRQPADASCADPCAHPYKVRNRVEHIEWPFSSIGVWQDRITWSHKDGRFIRPTPAFAIGSPDGSPGPSGEAALPRRAGYHLTPPCHAVGAPHRHLPRAQSLEDVISMSVWSRSTAGRLRIRRAAVERLHHRHRDHVFEPLARGR